MRESEGGHVDKNVEIEKTIVDGRLAERHVSYNENGDKIVEIFTEEKRPLHLEKRIVQKYKQIVAEEIIENVKDGNVIEREVLSVEPPAQLKVVEHVGMADHAKLINSEYATKKDVTDAVVAAVASLLGNVEVKSASVDKVPEKTFVPVAEKKLAERVAEKPATDSSVNIVLVALIALQAGAVYWVFFM